MHLKTFTYFLILSLNYQLLVNNSSSILCEFESGAIFETIIDQPAFAHLWESQATLIGRTYPFAET